LRGGHIASNLSGTEKRKHFGGHGVALHLSAKNDLSGSHCADERSSGHDSNAAITGDVTFENARDYDISR
jgi:hypothetical protein